jgi:iron(II)-dependent oxidoreductase
MDRVIGMNDMASLLRELDISCQRMTSLATSLSADQLAVPMLPGINPPVWELGHGAFFFERLLFQPLDGSASINPNLDDIWDSFELVHEDRWEPGLFPGLDETLAYFNEIHRRLRARIESRPLTQSELYLYRYGIHHLHMHMESMTWCRQTLAYAAPTWMPALPRCSAGAGLQTLDDIAIPAGRYRIGMPAQSPDFATRDFCFDNEKPAFDTEVSGFQISRTLVTNGEFLAFVQAGGYENEAWWSRAGRRWLKQTGQKHPLYWTHTADGWKERVFDQSLVLDPDSPVRHISYREALAWCAFAGRRLPTEIEWEVAALGRLAPADGSACASVDSDQSPFGCQQMMGALWQWTSTTFLPYDGFAVDMYPLMSTLQFGTHKVARGGSFASTPSLLRGTYRQAYWPDRNDIFAGFRTCAL